MLCLSGVLFVMYVALVSGLFCMQRRRRSSWSTISSWRHTLRTEWLCLRVCHPRRPPPIRKCKTGACQHGFTFHILFRLLHHHKFIPVSFAVIRSDEIRILLWVCGFVKQLKLYSFTFYIKRVKSSPDSMLMIGHDRSPSLCTYILQFHVIVKSVHCIDEHLQAAVITEWNEPIPRIIGDHVSTRSKQPAT